MPVISVSSSEAFVTLTSKASLCIVDFYATWCGPCKMVAPRLEKMSEQYRNVTFLKVDVDEVGDVAASAGVQAMPTFIFYKNGNRVGEVVGANVDGIKKKIEELGGVAEKVPPKPYVAGSVYEITDSESYNNFIKEHDMAVVDYFATWCGPCVRFAPTFHDLAAKNTDIAFAKVDVDELRDVAKNAGIQAMPTFHFFHKGERLTESRGADEKEFKKNIDKLLIAAGKPAVYAAPAAAASAGAAEVKKGQVNVTASEEDLKSVIEGNKYVIVDFYAQWCGPCKMFAPKFEEFAKSNSDVVFTKIDIDECESAAEAYNISSVPTFILFKDGKQFKVLPGANEDKFRDAVTALKE